ncbi:MAG: family 20 glycosylhydrolase [Victivallaceae bacterium]
MKNRIIRPGFPLSQVGGYIRPLAFLTPYPQQLRVGKTTVNLSIRRIVVLASNAMQDVADILIVDLREICGIAVVSSGDNADFVIKLEVADQQLKPEGYTLTVSENAAEITGQDVAGLFYGVQTFLQLVAFGQEEIPALKISDWPTCGLRSVMLDMGRAIYSKALIMRTIRIMSRLKLNTLHLHLYDDHLMGLRFKHLPLGSENPGAITIDELAEIVKYARQYHISVCPELESWGHVGSLMYHYPECYGDTGMYMEGASLGIGPKSFNLLEKIYDEVIPALETESMVHLGLDEARWKALPDVKNPESMNPTWLVGQLYDLLMNVGRRHNKNLTMRIWADHGGRALPSHLEQKIIVEPWQYFEKESDIKKKIRRFSGAEKGQFIMGGGSSSMHLNGSFDATRLWCEAGKKSPNCLGINICLWESNRLESYLISLFGGAACAWSPQRAEKPLEGDILHDYHVGVIFNRMLSWQSLFSDANPDALLSERGPAVYKGYYISGLKIGQPVAPTVLRLRHPVIMHGEK